MQELTKTFFFFFSNKFGVDQPYITSLCWIPSALANSLMLMTVFLKHDMYTETLIRKECVWGKSIRFDYFQRCSLPLRV